MYNAWCQSISCKNKIQCVCVEKKKKYIQNILVNNRSMRDILYSGKPYLEFTLYSTSSGKLVDELVLL